MSKDHAATRNQPSADPIAAARVAVDQAQAEWLRGRAALDVQLREAEGSLATAIADATRAAQSSAELESKLASAGAAVATARAGQHAAQAGIEAARIAVNDPSIDASEAAHALRTAEVIATRAANAVAAAEREHKDAAAAVEALAAQRFTHPAIPFRSEEIAALRARRKAVLAELHAITAEGESRMPSQWKATVIADDFLSSSDPRVRSDGSGHRAFQQAVDFLNCGNDTPGNLSIRSRLELIAAGTYVSRLRLDRAAEKESQERTARDGKIFDLKKQAGALVAALEKSTEWIGQHGDASGELGRAQGSQRESLEALRSEIAALEGAKK